MTGAAPAESQPGGPSLTLETLATGLALPVAATHAGDASGRLFVAELKGKILIFDGVELLFTPFLDIGSLVSAAGNNGLHGVAFHPAYATNGFFYLSYSDTSHDTVVARYEVSAADPDAADPSSAEILLHVPQPTNDHNGNQLAFGPDGYLYVAMGDGGTPGDEENNAQDLEVLLGKVLRIDVDGSGPGASYAIPPDNPFVDDPLARDEIWAYGLRNPWRFSFDRATGDLLIGDVGQGNAEEVDFQPASSSGGENYGWRLMEGSTCFDPPQGCNGGHLTLPIIEYPHDLGCSVTGGYRYRGSQHPELEGVYLFGDFCSGTIWGAYQGCTGWSSFPLLESGLAVVSFGEDEAGEIYVVEYSANDGKIHRLAAAGSPPGIFTDCFESAELSAWSAQSP